MSTILTVTNKKGHDYMAKMISTHELCHELDPDKFGGIVKSELKNIHPTVTMSDDDKSFLQILHELTFFVDSLMNKMDDHFFAGNFDNKKHDATVSASDIAYLNRLLGDVNESWKNTSYCKGYNDGYRRGREYNTKSETYNNPLSKYDDYDLGYQDGYQDASEFRKRLGL